MTRAYVLDQSTRAIEGLLEQSWSKLAYTRRYYGMDTFEMQIHRARFYASAIATNKLLYLPDESDRIFLIEQIESVSEGSPANDLLTVSGRSLEGIAMEERIVIPPSGQAYDRQSNVPAETAIKHYVTDHAGTGAASARQIPDLTVVATAGGGANVYVSGRYQTLFNLVRQIGILADIGWEIVYDAVNDEFDFDTIIGVDRSASVFFDFEFDTLEKWVEVESLTDTKTVAVVGGQGEGTSRQIVTRWDGTEPTGFARRELFIDARDVEVGETDELNGRGDTALQAGSKLTALEATVHQFGAFRYLTDWDIGDIVLVRNEERGISYDARIVEVTVSFAESIAAPKVVATLDKPIPTLKDKIEAAGGLQQVDLGGGGVSADLYNFDHFG